MAVAGEPLRCEECTSRGGRAGGVFGPVGLGLLTWGPCLACEWLTRVTDDPWALEEAPLSVRAHRQVVMAAARRRGRVLRFASEAVRDDREVVLAAIRESCETAGYEFASKRLRADLEVCLAAVALDPELLGRDFVPPIVCDNPTVVLRAIEHSADGLAVRHASDVLRSTDRSVLLAAFAKMGLGLPEGVAAPLTPREAVLAAVKVRGVVLELAPEELRRDSEIVAAAVAQDLSLFEHLSEELRDDRRVVLAAVSRDTSGEVIAFASERLRGDQKVAAAAVRSAGAALWHLSPELQVDRAVVIAAVRQNWRLFQRLPARLQQDREIVESMNVNSLPSRQKSYTSFEEVKEELEFENIRKSKTEGFDLRSADVDAEPKGDAVHLDDCGSSPTNLLGFPIRNHSM